MKGIVDRFEGEFAVVELQNKEIKNIRKELLPKEAKVGDFIELVRNKYIVDKKQTEKVKKRINSLIEDIWE